MSEKKPKVLVWVLDGPDSHRAYGSDVLPGEEVGQYRRRKEREREALSARSSEADPPGA